MEYCHACTVILANKLWVRIERLKEAALNPDYVTHFKVHMQVIQIVAKPHKGQGCGQCYRWIHDGEGDAVFVRSFACLRHRVTANDL